MKVTAFDKSDWDNTNPYCVHDGAWATHAWISASPTFSPDEKTMYYGDVYHIDSKLNILRVYRARTGKWDTSVSFEDYRSFRQEAHFFNLEAS